MQRKLNSSLPKPNIARDGAPKITPDAPVKPGMVRQTKGDMHPYLHGQPAPLDDEKEPPIKSHERAIPLHSATTPKQRATVHPIVNDPKAILQDAARLGRPEKA